MIFRKIRKSGLSALIALLVSSSVHAAEVGVWVEAVRQTSAAAGDAAPARLRELAARLDPSSGVELDPVPFLPEPLKRDPQAFAALPVEARLAQLSASVRAGVRAQGLAATALADRVASGRASPEEVERLRKLAADPALISKRAAARVRREAAALDAPAESRAFPMAVQLAKIPAEDQGGAFDGGRPSVAPTAPLIRPSVALPRRSMTMLQEPTAVNINRLIAKAKLYMLDGLKETFTHFGLGRLFSEERSSDEVAMALGLDPEAFQRFALAAASAGLLRKTGPRSFAATGADASTAPFKWRGLFWLSEPAVQAKLANRALRRKDAEPALGPEAPAILDDLLADGILVEQGGRLEISARDQPYLQDGSPSSILPMLRSYAEWSVPLFGKRGLGGALASGKSQWRAIFGDNASTPFDLHKTRPEAFEQFMLAMHLSGAHENAAALRSLDLSGARSVLDVGGGAGSVSLELLSQNPRLEDAVVYERADLIPSYERILGKLPAPEATKARLHFAPGDFFAGPDQHALHGLPASKRFDVVLLGWILHDWSDDAAVAILRKAAGHLKKGGRLLLLECVLPDDRQGPHTMLDLTMLLQTEGRERTRQEYEALLARAGLTLKAIHSPDTRRQIIEAVGAQ